MARVARSNRERAAIALTGKRHGRGRFMALTVQAPDGVPSNPCRTAYHYDLHVDVLKAMDPLESPGSHWLDAASSIRVATSTGWETISACEAPSMTTVFTERARSAMSFMIAGGMFRSAEP